LEKEHKEKYKEVEGTITPATDKNQTKTLITIQIHQAYWLQYTPASHNH